MARPKEAKGKGRQAGKEGGPRHGIPRVSAPLATVVDNPYG